jgi:two-component system nitrogen regulation response regulator GlnG/two-component system response regulator HydG
MPEERTRPPDAPRPTRVAYELVPAFVIVWSADEPERIGEVALVADDGADMILGRGSEGLSRRIQFFRERPDLLEPRAPISSPGISREQLVVRRVGDALRVVRKGQPGMLHNGARCEDLVFVRPGDTLEIESEMLLYCTERPTRLPAMKHGTADGAFGGPDADGIIGESAAAWKVRDSIAYAREGTGHVLITGESGTGKELAARAIHARSRRADKAFIAQNAATIPAGLIDAELFGNPKNYPNAGMPERPGLVGQANGGVLFLDEIGELSEELQARLLRVLDANGEYLRLGEAVRRTSDLGLVAATNRDTSTLKHDLVPRFEVRVALPSLRERREDVPLLVRALVLETARKSPKIAARFLRQRNGRTEIEMSPALMSGLVRWPYTTNVREISVLLSQAMEQSADDTLSLPKEMEGLSEGAAVEARAPVVVEDEPSRDVELSEEQVRAAFEREQGNVSRAAKSLGVTRQSFYRRLKKYGISDA